MPLSTAQLQHADNIIQSYRRRLIKAKKRGRCLDSTVREVRWQHLDMSVGGDGGPTGLADRSTIRGQYYKGYPNSFFQLVCDAMGWKESENEKE